MRALLLAGAALCVVLSLALSSDVKEMAPEGMRVGDLSDSEGSLSARRNAFQKEFVGTLQAHGVATEKAESMYKNRQHIRQLGEAQGVQVEPEDSKPDDTIYTLKHKANRQAKNLLELEGELSRLVTTNAMHPSSIPGDFDVANHMLKTTKMKGGVMTASTSQKYMREQNEKFLEKEQGKMKELLEEEYAGKKQQMKKEMMEQHLAAQVKKMEAKFKEEHNTMAKDGHQNKAARLKELYDMQAKEKDLVIRYDHLRKHRAASGLTVDGPVQKLTDEEPVKTSAIAGAAPQERPAAAEAPEKPAPENPPAVTSTATAEEEPEAKGPEDANLSKLGPTHRRRNPPQKAAAEKAKAEVEP